MYEHPDTITEDSAHPIRMPHDSVTEGAVHGLQKGRSKDEFVTRMEKGSQSESRSQIIHIKAGTANAYCSAIEDGC